MEHSAHITVKKLIFFLFLTLLIESNTITNRAYGTDLHFDDFQSTTKVSNYYEGVTFSTMGCYPDAKMPGGNPIPGAVPDYNAYVRYEPIYAQSGNYVIGGRTISGVAGGWLEWSRMVVIAVFDQPVDFLSIYGISDANNSKYKYQVKAYDLNGQLINPPYGFVVNDCQHGYTLEINLDDTFGKLIKKIEFGGVMGMPAYFDDLQFNSVPMCMWDFDPSDGDVDGSDLAVCTISTDVDLREFADEFGKNNCSD